MTKQKGFFVEIMEKNVQRDTNHSVKERKWDQLAHYLFCVIGGQLVAAQDETGRERCVCVAGRVLRVRLYR